MIPDAPIERAELASLFSALAPYDGLVLAVSGGADSMALMHLVAAWAGERTPAPGLLVATVDHGLRPGSAGEARLVGEQARGLGLDHETLIWRGVKPASGLQEAARDARYALLTERARRERGSRAIVTAHHREDQVETFLMRLSRGSGLDGLTGMRREPDRDPAESCVIERPLLGVPKARLVATLQRLGHRWIDDPSNTDTRFERVRLRAHRPGLDAAGLGSEAILRSMARLERARQALERGTGELWSACVQTFDGAYASIDGDTFVAGPEELRVRLLARVLGAFGGASTRARLSEVERLAARLTAECTSVSTLGGCVVVSKLASIEVFREPGRSGLPRLPLKRGESRLWDRRFIVRWSGGGDEGEVRVEALGPLAASFTGRSGAKPMPHRALVTLPSFWRGEALIAVPHLDARPHPHASLRPASIDPAIL